MKILLIAMLVCFLVVVFYFFGPWWGLGVSLVLLVTSPFIIFAILKYMKRTPPPSAPAAPVTPKKGLGWGWTVIGVILLIFLTSRITSCHERKKADIAIKKEVAQAIDKKLLRYEWYWKLPAGVYIRGKNEKAIDERIADGIPKNDGSVWANVPYFEQGKAEVERIRLTRVGDKNLEGTWEQDNPKDYATVEVDEVNPGIYAGKITFKNGVVGRCYLKTIK